MKDLNNASTAELKNLVDCEFKIRSNALKNQGRQAMIAFLRENFWDAKVEEITITPPVTH